MIELKKKKLVVFGINYKVIAETKSKLKEKKLPDLSKLDMLGKFTKIESKGVTKACLTKACVTKACVTKACVTKACNTQACVTEACVIKACVTEACVTEARMYLLATAK